MGSRLALIGKIAIAKVDKSKMNCNKSRRTPEGPKKFVVKAYQDGTEKIIRYGDSSMRIKKSNPERRKSFRARHSKISRLVVNLKDLSERAKKRLGLLKNN